MTTATLANPSHAHPTDGQVTCQNCGHEYVGRYCSQCSQTADTHRINWHYIWHEIPHSVWHVDRGIAFTLRELLTRPGHTISDYIKGRRVNHYRPLALLILLGALVTFASHSLNVSFAEESQRLFNPAASHASNRVKDLQKEVTHFVENRQTLLHIAFIPLYAFWFWLLFRRRGYNYPEMLVTQTFVANFNLVLSLVIVLLFWALGGSASAFSFVMSITLIGMMGYNSLVYSYLFKGKLHLRTIILRSVVAYLLSYMSFSLIGGGIGAVYALTHQQKLIQTQTKPVPQPTDQHPH